MKALSILQPWAWAITQGVKRVENRRWATKFRGQFLIHAGKKWGPEQRDDLAWILARFPHLAKQVPKEFERGGVVGVATLTDCVSERDDPWFFGPCGFVLADARPLPFHACPGKLGFFNLELEREISIQETKQP